MNAIDPSVIEDVDNGKLWMHYGSYFVACAWSLTNRFDKGKGDLGHLIAGRPITGRIT